MRGLPTFKPQLIAQLYYTFNGISTYKMEFFIQEIVFILTNQLPCNWSPSWIFGVSPEDMFRLQLKTRNCHRALYCNTIQYNTIQYNTIQYNTIQYATQRNATPLRCAALRSAAQRSAAQRSAAQRSAAQRSAAQRSAAQRSAAQRSAAQRSAAQYSHEYK